MYKIMIQTIMVPENLMNGEKAIPTIQTQFIEFEFSTDANKAFDRINETQYFDYGNVTSKTRAVKLY